MALFDMLVHDTLLTSWQDHVLAPSLYFRTRDKDTFGSSDLDKEAKQRKKDDLAAARIDQAAKQSQEWAKGTRAARRLPFIDGGSRHENGRRQFPSPPASDDRPPARDGAGRPPQIYCPTRNSIRRFRARPSAVSFGAIG